MQPAAVPMSFGLLMILAGLTSLSPLGTDIYLSAVPAMSEAFGVPFHEIELSVAIFVYGIAAGQLMGGPLSDRYGRRTIILTGLAVFCVTSIGMLITTDVEVLWGLRLLQALGSGFGSVAGMAVVRDRSSGKEGAINLMRVVQIMLFMPLAAPLIGMVILQLAGWRAIFVFMVVYAVAMWILVFKTTPETSPKTVSGSLLGAYPAVMKDKRIWGYWVSTCGAYAGLFAFITASPTVYMGFFELSPTVYPFAFGANAVAMFLVGKLNIRALRYYSAGRLSYMGQGVQLVAGTCMLVYLLTTSEPNFWVVMTLTVIFMGCHAFIVANSTSSTTEFFPQRAGTATALLSSTGFFSGAVAGTLVGVLADGTPVPMISFMLGGCVVAVVVRVGHRFWLRSHTPAEVA